jgi:hypothetical protein
MMVFFALWKDADADIPIKGFLELPPKTLMQADL